MSKKLEAKNTLIEVPVRAKVVVASPESPVSVSRTRTAVGGMAQFVATQSPIHKEAELLREQIKAFDGARLVRALRPESIVPSPWANRHEDTFVSSEFAELKREIKDAGGNVQPIKVRTLNGSTHADLTDPTHEIVFGHRRHRACLELNLPVNALIEEVDDQALFQQMERENRGRKNLSAWEQGCMYQLALGKGLYPSQRKLSESIGVDLSLISKSIALAKLPKVIIDAFPSPLDIQFRWAQPLGEALQKDPEGVIAKAKSIHAARPADPKGASDVFRHLTGQRNPKHVAADVPNALQIRGQRAGEISIDKKGGLSLVLNAGALSDQQRIAFLDVVKNFLNSL